MKTLMFSGHCMKPHIKSMNDIIYCNGSAMLKLNIVEKIYLMHYNRESQAEINVIGWCLKGFQTSNGPFPKNPIRGNIAFTQSNGEAVNEEDTNEICMFIENQKYNWAENVVLYDTRLIKEYVTSNRESNDPYEEVKAVINMYRIIEKNLFGRGSQANNCVEEEYRECYGG